MTLNESALLDAKAAAAKLGVSMKTLYALRTTCGLPTVKLGPRRIAFDPADITKYVELRKVVVTPAATAV